MNRSERRRLEKQGVNKKAIIDQTLQDAYEKGVKDGMKAEIEITFYMTAYTLNYKLGFGRKRLQETMYNIYNNIDAFRMGHLTRSDYEEIKEQIKKMKVELN